MGWSYDAYPSSKATFLADLDRGIHGTILKRHHSGNHYWRLVQDTAGGVYILLDLLARPGHGMGWGSKGMDESSHPYYYSCPVAWLDLAPETCPAWRKIVREQAALKAGIKAQLKVGAVVKLKDRYDVKVPLTIVSMRPLRGQTAWATTFRLSLKHIGAIVPTVEVV